MHISSRIERDLRRLVGGNKLNSAPVVCRWRVPRRGWVHVQSTPALEWTVEHGLGGFALTQVVTSGGAVLRAGLEHLDMSRVRVSFTEVESGTVVCVRPDVIAPLASGDVTLTHGLATRPLCQVIDAVGRVVAATVSWPSASVVRVVVSGWSAGMQVLLASAEHVASHGASAEWVVNHGLNALPILESLDAGGAGLVAGVLLVSGMVATMEFSEPEVGMSLAVARGAAEYDHAFENPNVEASISATDEMVETHTGLVHFVQPVKSGVRLFAEIETGDVIVDFPQDVPLSDKRGIYFEIDGTAYVQKDVGDALAEYWDLVLGGRRMMRTLVLTRKR